MTGYKEIIYLFYNLSRDIFFIVIIPFTPVKPKRGSPTKIKKKEEIVTLHPVILLIFWENLHQMS